MANKREFDLMVWNLYSALCSPVDEYHSVAKDTERLTVSRTEGLRIFRNVRL